MSMLDLNLSMFHVSAPESQSGETSSSSVVNDDELDFGIIKKKSFVTRQLFPMMGQVSGSDWTTDPRGVGHVAQLHDQVQVVPNKQPVVKKSRRGPRSRSSQYRGVTFYRRTGRWESHIWDCGKQVYLGGFDTAHAAARAYDRAAIKFRGVEADINFVLGDYEEDMNQTKNLSKEEFIHILRRQSTGFSRGSSKYRGVTLHKCGRWEARMGQFLGKKAYDKAALKCNGKEAVTNFEPSTYEGDATSDVAGGGDQCLELRLGISTPSCGYLQKDNQIFGHPQLHPFSLYDSKRPKTDNPASTCVTNLTLEGQPMTSEHPSLWTAMYPNCLPSYKERAAEKRTEGSTMLANQNWVWPRQGQISATSAAFSSAASSGFSGTIHPTKPHNSIPPFNLCFPSPTMGTANPQYFYQMKPPQPAP